MISSVLVSNTKHLGAIGSEVSRNRTKSEEEIEETLDVSFLIEENDEPLEKSPKRGPEYLNYRWSFWYDNTTKKIPKKDYLSSLHKLNPISTLPEFFKEWRYLYDNIVPTYQPETNLRFFHNDVIPMWEDPHNVNGGKWVIVYRQKPGFKTTQLWQSLLLSMMLGELGFEDEIFGTVLSIRTWGYMFTIWNKDSNNQYQIEKVSKKLSELFGTEKVKYQSHQDAIMKTSHAYRKQQEIERKMRKLQKKQQKDQKENFHQQVEKENFTPNTSNSPPTSSEGKKEFRVKESKGKAPNQGEYHEKPLHAGISSDNEKADATLTHLEEQVKNDVQTSTIESTTPILKNEQVCKDQLHCSKVKESNSGYFTEYPPEASDSTVGEMNDETKEQEKNKFDWKKEFSETNEKEEVIDTIEEIEEFDEKNDQSFLSSLGKFAAAFSAGLVVSAYVLSF